MSKRLGIRLYKRRWREEKEAEAKTCPFCGVAWEPDCNQFGCWSCGYRKEDK